MSASVFRRPVLILMALSLLLVQGLSEIENSIPDFEPTDEWQEVLEGQAIPPGLHVKMDMNTGQKFAKIDTSINENYNSWNYNPVAVSSSDDQKKPALSIEEWAEVLKVLGGTNVEDPVEKMKEYMDFIRKWEEQLYPRNSRDQVVIALESLRDLLHDVNLARDWVTLGGMKDALSILSVDIDNDLMELVFSLMGAAAQNNQEVAQSMQEIGATPVLVQKIQHLFYTEERMDVVSRAMFALLALVRSSEPAMKEFITLGGEEILKDMLKADMDSKLRNQLVGLVQDIHSSSISEAREISWNSWCADILSLASSSTNIDVLERIIYFLQDASRAGSCSFAENSKLILHQALNVNLDYLFVGLTDEEDIKDVKSHIQELKEISSSLHQLS